MKRKLACILTGVLMVCLCVGCGQISSLKRTTDTTVENVVEKGEKEALQLSELAQGSGSLMCVTNDSIFVATSEDSCVYANCIRQYNRQGTELRSYSLDKGCVEGISAQFVCYTERSKEDEEILYIAPIEKEKGEETIVLKKKKRLQK